MDDFDKRLEALCDEIAFLESIIQRNKIANEGIAATDKMCQKKIDTLRGDILYALGECGLVNTKTQNYTITKKATPQKIIIFDEDILPDRLMRITKTPDKGLIKTAIDNGESINGAGLSNGGETIQIRVRK